MREKRFLKVVISVATLVVVISIGIVGYYIYSLAKSQEMYEKMKQETEEQETVLTEQNMQDIPKLEENALEAPGDEKQEREIDFHKLQTRENEDIYAWIEVEGTLIDYPILQHPTDDQYYLIHNVDNSYGYPGCIFTERVAAKDFTDPVTVVYGHRMKNGTMFAGLHDFEDEDFFEKNGRITIYTPEGNHYYEVIAAFVTNNQKITYWYDFTRPEVLQNYLDAVYQMEEEKGNHVKEEIQVTTEDRFLILETCTKQSKDKRYVVMAVEMDE